MATTADIEISRKLSILSAFSDKFAEERKVSNKHDTSKGPKDFMFAVHIACFFVGFMNVMPMVFFSTAKSYWMYKFRNVTLGDAITEGQDRTRLQVYFQPALMAGGTVPSVICTILLTFYGHKIPSMFRSLASLVLLGLVFAIFAIFTQINTDSWQTGFFALTVILLMMNSEKYFTPTIVFLLAEISSIVGRVLSRKFLVTHSNKWWYILALTVRLICTPFYLFCNAQPRSHLPVIFGHDWEFITGHILFSMSMGFLMHVGFMSIRTLAEGKTEVGLKIVTLTLSLVSAASTFNGFLTVMLL
ncbi:uncharacterized protein [Diabrotica undecimpunctata]|uniref:uncharacterized protein isoform X2 n=1 Tax=Diabrotica undecimpunctata TaxID=50387 RepID=UPI003B63FA49